MSTESAVVPRAVFDLRGRVDVLERAFFVQASAELLVEVTFGHFRHVVFVEKLAIVALLAQTAQPMLANHSSIAPLMWIMKEEGKCQIKKKSLSW